jgi:crossover junction endodeoxyribonuclease RusA
MSIHINVTGLPVPQGSKRAFINRYSGRANIVENNAAGLHTWRNDVRAAALENGETIPAGEPVSAGIIFYLPRPKSHYGTGRNADLIKPSAPDVPAGKPDLDKLVRGVLDALTSAGTYTDDSRVVLLVTSKRYADGRGPGAEITLTAWSSIITLEDEDLEFTI